MSPCDLTDAKLTIVSARSSTYSINRNLFSPMVRIDQEFVVYINRESARLDVSH